MKKILFASTLGGLLVLSFGLMNSIDSSLFANAQNESAEQHRTMLGSPEVKPEVKIDNFSFGPSTLTVPAGASVTWVNHDDVPHKVMSTTGKLLNSPVLDTDEKFSHKFDKAGSYSYYCSIHPKMTGKVIVQ
jgi:plastocyanin